MSPDSEQAQGPVADTQEMGFPDFACVVFRLSKAVYRPLFEAIWGAQSFAIRWPSNTKRICSTPGGAAMLGDKPTPVSLTPMDRGIASATFDAYAHSITAYEASPDVGAFSSKFDAFLAGNATLTVDEKAGLRFISRQGELQFLPSRRKRGHSYTRSERQQQRDRCRAFLHRRDVGQSRASQEPGGSVLL
jgi:cytochrome c peroxidase